MSIRPVARIITGVIIVSGIDCPAHSQLAADVSLASDIRLRGLSLNGGRPVLTAGLAYDHPSGLYAGAAVSAGDTRRFGVQLLNATTNLGYAQRLSSRMSWEVGIADTRVNSSVYQRFSGGYAEAYMGLSSEHASLRIFYSPAFFVRGLNTAYFDINGTLRPQPRLRVFGHAGLLVPLGGPGANIVPRARYDLRAGLAAERGRGELQLSWVRSGAGSAFLAPRRQSPDALILSATWSF